ncbi:hypothetical protein [Lentzea tibetensis]|nr:hypothetical protein [Lentzea tibetensis]
MPENPVNPEVVDIAEADLEEVAGGAAKIGRQDDVHILPYE